MMEKDGGKDKALQSLINKINHPLSEVRCRSLRNILFKLQNELISLSELVCEDFLRYLLEWFNYPECSHESHVLELIDRLIVQHEDAAQMLLELGGVEFLSQLRLYSDESLHGHIDAILDHMLNLREMSIVQSGSITDSHSNNVTAIPAAPVTTATPINAVLSAQSFVTETTTLSGLSLGSVVHVQDCETQTVQPVIAEGTMGVDPVADTHDNGVVVQEPGYPQVFAQCHHLLFPWIILSQNDQHILFATDGRLQNNDESLVMSSCEFICDVLLQDFPAELFLQRPVIVKSLLKLVSLTGSTATVSKALECLYELTSGLQYRLSLLHDPSLAHTDTVSSYVTYISAAMQQQGCEDPGEAVAFLNELEDVNSDKMKLLQAGQLRIDQYCHMIVGHCITVLLDLLNKKQLDTLNTSNSSNSSLLCGVLRLLQCSVELLRKSTAYHHHHQDDEQQEFVQESLTNLVEVLTQCMSKWQRCCSKCKSMSSQGAGGGDNCHLLSTTCTILTHITWCFSEILTLQIPIDSCTDHLPSNSGLIINDIIINGYFSECCPNIITNLLPYLKHLDQKSHDAYTQAGEMKKLFVKANSFLTLPTESSSLEQVQAAIECLPSLVFPHDFNEMIVDKCMKLCVRCLSTGDLSCMPLLLELISYPSDGIKVLTYEHLEQAVVRVEQSTDVLLTALVESELLVELVCRGLGSKVTKVDTASQHIIAHLLTLVISKPDLAIADKLCEKINRLLPYLEAGLSDEEATQKLLQSFIVHRDGTGLSHNQKITCSLRLMLSRVSALRVWALSVLSKQLVSEYSANKRSPFSSVGDSLLHDVLVSATPPSGEHKVGTQCSLNREDVSKLTKLLTSKSLDVPLKKSSLEQLYIVLQDYTLHEAAIQAGVIDHLLSVLADQLKHEGTTTSTASGLPLLPSCVGCLRLLAHTSASVRSNLVSDNTFLLDTLRGVLLCQSDTVLRYNTSKLLLYLLYTDVAVFTHPAVGNGVSIPHQILCKLQLPYSVTTSYPNSTRTFAPVIEPSMMDNQATVDLLRVYHLTSAHSSVNELVQSSTSSIPPDVMVFTNMDPQCALHHSIVMLEKATSHSEVAQCLDHISIVMIRLSVADLSDGVVDRLKRVVGKFLVTAPASVDDCDLFCRVLHFCSHTFLTTATPTKAANEKDYNKTVTNEKFTSWLYELNTSENCLCLRLLSHSPETSSIETDLIPVQKVVMKFYSSLLAHSPSGLFKGSFCIQLMDTLCCRLDMAGSPSYYDLPFLETSLHCLLHLTAQPLTTMSAHVMAPYMRLAVSLRQVLWSFISGRGEAFASFMGKGVTLQAALALCHLMYNVTLLDSGEKLCSEWITLSPTDVGLSWIHSLIQDRGAQVRCAGYTLMGVLCTQRCGVEALLAECQSIPPAGLWSVCIQTLLNTQECGMVRGKAGEVILQLIKCCQHHQLWDKLITYSIQDGGVLSGLEAFHSTTQHYNVVPFLQEVLMSLNNNPTLFSVNNDEDDSNVFTDCCHLRQITVTVVPYFISSVCRILHNTAVLLVENLPPVLHHNGLDNLLIRFIDDKLLSLVLQGCTHSSITLLSSWVLMMTDMLLLLHAMIQLSPQLFLTGVATERHLNSLFNFITLTNKSSTDRDVYRELVPLCHQVMSLLCTIGRGLKDREVFFTIACTHWTAIITLVKRSADDQTDDLTMAAFSLLNLILSHWFRPASSDPVDEACQQARLELVEGTSQSCDLCTLLLSAYDGNSLRGGHKGRNLAGHTLAVLLACSDTAKNTAMKAGLMESSIEVLRNLHTKLCMSSLDGSKKKASPLVSEAIQTVHLMRNFLYKSEQVKLVAVQCQLSAAVHKLWPWCIVDRSLLLSVLLMLATFTAHCPKACLSLCSLTCGSTSLMQSVIKEATRVVSSYQTPTVSSRRQHHVGVLTAVFSLLANATLSTECRGLLRKFSFLDLFSTLRPRAECSIPGRLVLYSCWLQLLVNLTRYSDGQQMVLKQPDAVELIVELWQCGSDVRTMAVLLVRNLCFYAPTKTLLASNENFLALLQAGLSSQQVKDIAMASSAVWALLSGCRKIRASLKRSPLPGLLQTCHTILEESGSEEHKKCLVYVSHAMKLLQ